MTINEMKQILLEEVQVDRTACLLMFDIWGNTAKTARKILQYYTGYKSFDRYCADRDAWRAKNS